MTTTTAKKILADNGICWSNYFDLDFIERNAGAGHERILAAIRRMKKFILQGK